MAKNLPSAMGIGVQLLHHDSTIGSLTLPSFVRSTDHAMYELRGLNALVLHLALRLGIDMKRQLNGQPCSKRSSRIHVRFAKPCPSSSRPLGWRQASQPERFNEGSRVAIQPFDSAYCQLYFTVVLMVA
jgi:hypothetical protein